MENGHFLSVCYAIACVGLTKKQTNSRHDCYRIVCTVFIITCTTTLLSQHVHMTYASPNKIYGQAFRSIQEYSFSPMTLYNTNQYILSTPHYHTGRKWYCNTVIYTCIPASKCAVTTMLHTALPWLAKRKTRVCTYKVPQTALLRASIMRFLMVRDVKEPVCIWLKNILWLSSSIDYNTDYTAQIWNGQTKWLVVLTICILISI